MSAREERADIVIVGSGGGGLAAAIKARSAGLNPLIIEKADCVGGTTAWSHGALWLPDNPLMQEAGIPDSVEEGLAYLQSVVGDQGPATTAARQEAFIRGGQRLISFLRDEGVVFRLVTEYPDYYPDAPGGKQDGRMLMCPLFDARELGNWQDYPRPRPPMPGGLVMHSVEQFRTLLGAGRDNREKVKAGKIAFDSYAMKARGVKPMVMGQAYIARLLAVAQRHVVQICMNTRMRSLLVEDGQVVGVVAEQNGEPVTYRARHGVLLNGGGFARNAELRERFGPHPASAEWTAVNEGDTGDPFLAATAIGAATSNLDKAYWLPGLMNKDGVAEIFVAERHSPHSILVDHGGERFANEAQSYMALGNLQYERHQSVPSIPAWLVIDSRHRKRTPLGVVPPGIPPIAWLKSGHLKKAPTLRELAGQCGIDADGLERTVERFNRMALAGVDEDFGRGESDYDRVYGDPAHEPNPCLGTIEEAPFYAAKMYPTDVGMAGGLLTDTTARVLNEDGDVIDGLYACGTTAASAMGDTYPGGGVSLGQSSVFGYVAAEHMIETATGAPDAAAKEEALR